MNKSVSNADFDEDARISRVGAWKNKDEFNLVYDQLFGNDSDYQTKRLALDRMKVWKIRRLNLTPASILSTLSILDVQLKDVADNRFSSDELRSMYSNAFTRFLNYMSSILRSRTLQSMYSTARELGIESFLVDLRHLCAHGQVLPSLEISRRTADYCMNWLREFYWDREHNFIIDATVRDVHLKSSLELEESVRYWFTAYDVSTEAMSLGYKQIDDLTDDDHLDIDAIELLNELAAQIRNSRLSFIANRAINQLAQLSHSSERDRGNAYIYCDALFDCTNFMKRSAQFYNEKSKDEQTKFIGIHQNLFRLLAICDYVNVIFIRFVSMCEDDLEDDYERKASSFWANEIATGFIVFKEFKHLYKMKKEKNDKFDVDMAPINTDIMTDDIKKIYKQLGVNFHGTLIFGDTVRRPWSLHFERDFLLERATNINQYTVDVVKKCIKLIEPSLKTVEANYIERLLSIYMDQNPTKLSPANESMKVDEIHTLDDVLEKSYEKEKFTTSLAPAKNSIWREAPDGFVWKSCPLGSLP